MENIKFIPNTATFPFKYHQRQNAILFGANAVSSQSATVPIDWNSPHISHAENYMPTARGMTALRYVEHIKSISNTPQYGGFDPVHFERGLPSEWTNVAGVTLLTNSYSAGYKNAMQVSGASLVFPNVYIFQNTPWQSLTAGTKWYWRSNQAGQGMLPVVVVSTNGGTTYTDVTAPALSGSFTAVAGSVYKFGFKKVNSFGDIVTVYELEYGTEAGIGTPVHKIFATYNSSLKDYQLAYYAATGYVKQSTTNSLNWANSTAVNVGYTAPVITTAVVNSRGFANFYSNATNAKLYENDAVTAVTLKFKAIAASATYLLGITASSVYWSTPTNPLDFTSYGSGNGIPSGLVGEITAIVPISGGFVVFSEENAVFGSYTNLPTAPFRFTVIPNAGGISNLDQVGSSGSHSTAMAWTSKGLQLITSTNAVSIPEISDFLNEAPIYAQANSNSIYTFYNYNEITNRYAPQVKIGAIGNRYFTVSYKQSNASYYQHSLVLDLQLQRWGHVRIEHVHTLDYASHLYGPSTQAYPLLQLAFVHPLGYVLSAIPGYGKDFVQSTFGSTLVISGVRASHSKKTILQEVTLRHIESSVTVSTATDREVVFYQQVETQLATKVGSDFYTRVSGESHDIVIRGVGDITDISIGFTRSGD